MRVMIVEDEALIRMDLTFRIEALGHEVVATASEGSRAINKAREIRPEIILMDVQLKDTISGIDAARAIRSFLFCPICFVSAYQADQIHGLEEISPPQTLYTKPISDRKLLEIFNKCPKP